MQTSNDHTFTFALMWIIVKLITEHSIVPWHDESSYCFDLESENCKTW